MSVKNYRELMLLLNHYVANGAASDPEFDAHVDGAAELAMHIHAWALECNWWKVGDIEPLGYERRALVLS